MDSIATLLDEAATLPISNAARIRLEKRVLDETAITNFNQVDALVEAVAIHAALENGAHGDQDTIEALFAQAQTIADALRKMHELIQTLASDQSALAASVTKYRLVNHFRTGLS